MRARDEMGPDPEIVAELEAIDAALAGEPADPRFAGAVELALLVRADRPRMADDAAARLDARIAGQVREREQRPPRTWRSLWPVAGSLAAALAVAIVIVATGASRSPGSLNDLVKASPAAHGAASSTASRSAAAPRSTGGRRSAGAPLSLASPRSAAKSASSARPPALTTPAPNGASGSPGTSGGTFGSSSSSSSGVAAGAVPTSGGRRQVDSAQLQLSAPGDRIDDVAQEAFAVIGTENGIVEHSTVTAGGPGGSDASIAVSVPESNLAATMSRLSQLRYATVASRTDASQDVTGTYGADERRLADARALRSSLLRQLAAAVTQAQIDSLKARIHDAEAAISRAQQAVASLGRRVSRSQIELTIDQGTVPVEPLTGAGGGGFDIHRALHDAGRVLVVTAGVILIGLAALVPIAMLAALAAWLGVLLRRRTREQALDSA